MPARIYQVDAHALDAIDTEGKAYVVGFIAADGYVSNDGLGFTLHEKESDVLDHIKVVLGSTHQVRSIARHRLSLDISSRVLAARLAKLGLAGAKTTSVKPPVSIHTSLLPHWLRGYWDGDGWLTVRHRASGLVPHVRVAGWSLALMQFVHQLCCEYAEADLALGKYKGGWSVGMESENAHRWIARVYLGASIGLRRKQDKAMALYQLPPLSLGRAISVGRGRIFAVRNASATRR